MEAIMKSYDSLMKPLKIGNITVKNRLAVAPLGSFYLLSGPKGEYNDNAIEYLLERARGGFGLIVLGNVVGDMESDKPNVIDGQIPPAYAPNTWKESALRLTERIHVYGSKIFMQIGMGRGRMRANEKAPSRLPKYHNPKEMTQELTAEEIEIKIKWVIKTAKMAKSAGFDGVEIHAMHWGYLLDQFAMAITNMRTDEYGGNLRQRLTCARKIVEGIKAECGWDFPVSMRLGMKSYMKGFNQPSLDGSEEVGRTIEETCEVGKLLEEFGYDMLNCNSGVYDAFYYCMPPVYIPKGHNLKLAKQLKKAVAIPVFCAGRNDDPDMIEEAVATGMCDGISLGRASLADPYYAKKIFMGCPEQIHPCLACGNCMATTFSNGSPTCAVNPLSMKEGLYAITKAVQKKKVAIVGGGIGGMEAARVAAICGHKVDLYERDSELGGRLFDASAHIFKENVRRLNEWYKLQMNDLGVNVHLNTVMDVEKIKTLDVDTVILAVGSEPLMPRTIQGIDSVKAVSCVDVLTGKRNVGERVVIVGGGLVGAEMAYDYGLEGKKVTLIEALDSLMANDPNGVPYWVRDMLVQLLEKSGCDIRTGCRLKCINDKGVVISDKNGGKIELEADDVVIAIGFRARPSIADKLRSCGKDIYEIVASNGIGNIATQVSSAYEIARHL
jgi:2-enoate reductase